MTSVQNRPQLSNGNKLILFFLIIASISSCGATKKTQTQNYPTETILVHTKNSTDTKNGDSIIINKPVLFDIEKDEILDTTLNNIQIEVKNIAKKDIYNIAVILPFNFEQIPIGTFTDDTTRTLNETTKSAVDFYLGCLMAKNKYQKETPNINIYFLDDKNDSNKIVNLFNQKPFPYIDYIVGPTSNKNLKTAAIFAKNYKIPLISPIINSYYTTKNNPYFFNAISSNKTVYRNYANYFSENYTNKTIEILYDGQDSSLENINIFKNAILQDSANFKNLKFEYKSVRATDDIAKKLYTLDTLSERVIYIYTSTENYNKTILSKLKSIKNKLHIFVQPAIKNNKNIVIDANYKHQIITSSTYYNNETKMSDFSSKYTSKYKKKPTDFSFQAFDIMTYLFDLIANHENINTYKNKDLKTSLLHSNIYFSPVINKNNEVDFYDNKNLYFYKFENGSFKIIPTNK